jgi:hypothetical protein
MGSWVTAEGKQREPSQLGYKALLSDNFPRRWKF